MLFLPLSKIPVYTKSKTPINQDTVRTSFLNILLSKYRYIQLPIDTKTDNYQLSLPLYHGTENTS